MLRSFLGFAFLFFALSCFATVWHVNNNSNVIADFTTLQAANDNASVAPGDTLYLYGSPSNYGSATLNKQLYLIGPGYYLSENIDNQAVPYGAYVPTLTLNSGSSHSTVTGLTMNRLVINASHQTIKRNRIYGINSSMDLTVMNNVSDILFIQNYLYTNYSYSSGIRVTNSASNGILISNNIIYANDTGYACAISTDANVMLTYCQNVIYGTVNISRSDYYNNIQRYGSFSGDNSSVFNNIGNTTQYAPAGVNGNQCNVSMSSVFVSSGTSDGQYQLRSGSLAAGAGLNGEDCGAYGGDMPYVLSGMPSEIPTIYFFSSSGAGYELPVHIKAKTHN